MKRLRHAKPAESGAIFQIAQSVAHGWQGTDHGGFLLSRYTEADYLERLRQKEIYVSDAEDIRGYVILIPFPSPTLETIRRYLSQVEDRKVDFTTLPDLLWLDQVAVGAGLGHRGVGSALYEAMLARFPGAPILTAIAEKPDTNVPSMKFHKKFGFARIGTFRADDFFGVPHYQSGIFLRPAGT